MEITPRTKLSTLEFRIFREIGSELRASKRVLVACSGGADSVALAHLLDRIAPRLGFELGVAHIHHGKGAAAFRDRAQKFTSDFAARRGLPFFTAKYEGAERLKSESSLREFRLRALSDLATQEGYGTIALAHHQDDLLETRLIRMIRGTSAAGLRAMSVRQGRWLRPFLAISRKDVAEYALREDLKWLEDPSNFDSKYLRNWIRNEWLPMLETKRPGATESVRRSLETWAGEFDRRTNSSSPVEAIDCEKYRQSASTLDRLDQLGQYLRERGHRDFTSAQLREIDKQLMTSRHKSRGALRFTVAGLSWRADARRILAVSASEE